MTSPLASSAKPLFITLEGIEGTGKSTNIGFIRGLFEAAGAPLVVTREPGGTPLAEEIRHLLLQPREERVVPETELLLMFAARAQHLTSLIKPTLAAGISVLSDRFTDATYAYQGGGRRLSVPSIALLESFVQGDFRPDLTITLVVDPATGMARARGRGPLDRFEREDLDFYSRVQDVYLEMARRTPERHVVVDASLPLERVQDEIRRALVRRTGWTLQGSGV